MIYVLVLCIGTNGPNKVGYTAPGNESSSKLLRDSTASYEGGIQANPAHIKVYYWIQVFTSYITQDLDGKLQVTSDNISGYVETLNSITEYKLPNIINNLLPVISSSITAQISGNILNNLRKQLGIINPLTFTAIDPGVKISLIDNTNSNVLQFRRNSFASWQLYDGSNILLENSGDYVQFQNINKEWLNIHKDGEGSGLGLFKVNEQSSNKKYKASGNIQSLLNYNNYTIKNAYERMFDGCSNLITAPELQATNLEQKCYYRMFNGCSNLITVPKLYATTLAPWCCYEMFSGCSSLTIAPELPATTLAPYCYSEMFSECSSLTEAPELPATILAPYCYAHMFYKCSSLTEAPELPAETLADHCYYSMLTNCSSLTKAPELPAEILIDHCYAHMFTACFSLTEAPELPATILAPYCYQYMFANCGSLIEAPELPAETLASHCYYYMFRDCSSLTEAPELPAETLTVRCYSNMFMKCTNLIKAPELPATTLADYCYERMFEGCTSLNSINVKFTSWHNNAINYWVQNVSSTGTFTCPATLLQLFGVSRIPDGWTVQTI